MLHIAPGLRNLIAGGIGTLHGHAGMAGGILYHRVPRDLSLSRIGRLDIMNCGLFADGLREVLEFCTPDVLTEFRYERSQTDFTGGMVLPVPMWPAFSSVQITQPTSAVCAWLL